MKLSLIVSVLESYEVVRRQLLHLERLLGPECELILVDDGSAPPLQATCDSVTKTFPFVLYCTNDYRPWTQPRARNIGARLARAEKLLFFDIDHIVTKEIITECLSYPGDRLFWVRRPGILDEKGHIVTDRMDLVRHGLTEEGASIHANSFMIRKARFHELGGYDERFCGHYGGDDIDFNARYDAICRLGRARHADIRAQGYVFPDPAKDPMKLFHSLSREVLPCPSAMSP